MIAANDNSAPANAGALGVLDLFSAAAGGWSLGMHRAGFHTIAACEVIPWRRALYSQNNPGVPVYDDVTTLTAVRLIRDGVGLPRIIVGSPPCQDISSANTKGKGVDGERSGLYFEAIRLIDECRPDWFALENSANLRTRGADRVIDALEAIGYTCWPFVVSAGDIGANHERKRSWLIGCRIAYADGVGRDGWRQGRWSGFDVSVQDDTGHTAQDRRGQGRARGCAVPTSGLSEQACGYVGDADKVVKSSVGSICGGADTHDERGAAADTSSERRQTGAVVGGVCETPVTEAGRDDGQSYDGRGHTTDTASLGHESGRTWRHGAYGDGAPSIAPSAGNLADADETGQAAGLLESSPRSEAQPSAGRGSEWCDDGESIGQVGGRESAGHVAEEPWADWNGGLAHHLRVDDGLSGWVAQSRIAIGGPRGTVAASLIVEAFGDAVCPQIPEAIGRAILRVEAALAVIHGAPIAANDNNKQDIVSAA